MPSPDHLLAFEAARPVLTGLAYRMLGSRADAEDAVQDTFVKWQRTETGEIANPAAWLTTACTHRCIDLLRAANKARVDYVGAWLPEPLHTTMPSGPEDAISLASSLSTAFLLMLERLTPKERAAYLLNEIFEIPHDQTARMLGLREAACRKLVSRARTHVARSKVRHITPADRQDKLLRTFQAAVVSGDTGKLASLLSDDIEIRHDSGGKVGAAVHILHGKAPVLDFIHRFLHRVWPSYRWTVADLNGGRGLILEKDGTVSAAVSFAYDEAAEANHIFIVRNPDKLARLRDGRAVPAAPAAADPARASRTETFA